MPSAVISGVNHIGLAKGQSSLLTFYYRKGYPVEENDTNIAGVNGTLVVTGLNYENDEDRQDEYTTTDVDIGQDEQKDQQEDHEEGHNSHEHKNDNINPPHDDNHNDPQSQDIDPIQESLKTEDTLY